MMQCCGNCGMWEDEGLIKGDAQNCGTCTISKQKKNFLNSRCMLYTTKTSENQVLDKLKRQVGIK